MTLCSRLSDPYGLLYSEEVLGSKEYRETVPSQPDESVSVLYSVDDVDEEEKRSLNRRVDRLFEEPLNSNIVRFLR
jgi:hypothetical protein